MKRALTGLIVAAMLLTAGPASLADSLARGRESVRRVPETRVWPGGSIEERRHGPGDLSLFFVGTRGRVEVRMFGSADDFSMDVTAGGETRRVAFDDLLMRRGIPRWNDRATPTAGAARGGESVERWLSRTVGDGVVIAEEDLARLERAILEAVLAKGTCAGRIRAALAATAGYLGCFAAAAATGGAALPACFLIAAGAYFLTYAALEACNPGGNGSSDCNCQSSLPDCMCCEDDLDPGDPCACYCPGEECCNW